MIIKSVRQIVGKRALPQIKGDVSVREACTALDKYNVGALVVLDDTNALVGILSERDVIKKCICKGKMTADTLVSEVMTRNPYVAKTTSSISDALKIMVDGGFRHLPIIEGAKTVGLLSMRDIPTEYRLMFERYMDYVS